MNITFDCDNSKCKKPVKSFKVKLMRKITCYSEKQGGKQQVSFKSQEYLKAIKYDGISDKTKEKKVFEFELPQKDPNKENLYNLNHDQRQIISQLSDSTINSSFQIQYSLDVFVKHQSKLEKGMGNQETFDIDIKTQGLPIYCHMEPEWMQEQGILVWEPKFVGPSLELRYTKARDGTYLPQPVLIGQDDPTQKAEPQRQTT